MYSSPIAEPRSSSPSAPESPILRTADVEMKESEHKAVQSDEDMEMIKNTVYFADNVPQNFTKGIFTFLILEHCNLLFPVCWIH